MLHAGDVTDLLHVARSIRRVIASDQTSTQKISAILARVEILASGLELLAESVPPAPSAYEGLREALALLKGTPGAVALRRELAKVRRVAEGLGDPEWLPELLRITLSILGNDRSPRDARVAAARVITQNAKQRLQMVRAAMAS